MLKSIGLNGFKSFYGTGAVPFGALTILAGSNSSGKSTLFQPLLLMKQTLESSFDPGALLLEGPNVRVTGADQILSKQRSHGEDRFSLVIGLEGTSGYASVFKKAPGGFAILSQSISNTRKGEDKVTVALQEEEKLNREKISALAKINMQVGIFSGMSQKERRRTGFTAVRDRCLIGLSVDFFQTKGARSLDIELVPEISAFLKNIIHVPGLRGNPERNYKTTAVGKSFPGTFDSYVASVIQNWQNSNSKKLGELNGQLASIGLNSSVSAVPMFDTRVAIEVSRFGGAVASSEHELDRVSIADVGLGVSQVLSFLVALLVAREGQTVYVEQPELHLHPMAQYRLADVVRSAISRGVQVVMETHSSVLLRGIQTLAAKRLIDPEQVVLNWFSRDEETGVSRISSAVLGADGAMGDWPADFDEVTLAADAAYLDAAFAASDAANDVTPHAD